MGDRAQRQLFAEDLVAGQSFAGTPRRVAVEEFAAFARLTGDDHPIHYDEAFAAATRFGRPVAHGLLLMAMTALGATPMSHRLHEAMVALAEQRCRFLKPVFAGDVLTCRFEVGAVEHKPGRETALVRFNVRLLNQSDEAVLEGEHAYLLRWRRATGSDDAA